MTLAVRALAAALAFLPLPLVAQDASSPNTHDRAGRPLTAVDQQGRRYSYTYDPDGTQNRWFGKRLVSVKRPDGTLLEFGYNEHSERGQTRVTSPGKPPEIVTYPPQPADPPGQVTYDELGRLATHTDEKGHRARFTYDNESQNTWRGDRLLRVEKIDGTLIEFAYGPRGDRGETRITKPGKPPQVVKYPPQPADESRGKTYDHLGRWAGGTVNGQAVHYTYDGDGARNTWVGDRVVQILTPDGTFIEHAYGADGFLSQTRVTRPGQPTEVTDHPRPSTPAADTTGAQSTTTTPPPLAPPKAVAEKPVEPERRRAGGAGFAVVPAAASGSLALSEDPPGSTIILLVTRRTYDDFDRLETETTTLPDGTGERTVSYSYYRNGVRKTVTDPQGNVTFYTYDAQNRVDTVTTRYGTASAKTTTFGYWPDGLLKEVQYPNGVVASYGYDLADRLLTLTHAKGGEVISSYEYTYDANGNRLSQTETNGGVTEVTTYTYDRLNRLKTVTYPADTVYPQGRRVEYGYDAVGNRTSELTVDPVSGAVLASKTGTFDAVNRLQVLTNDLDPADTARFTWDANGNQTGKTQRGVTTTSVYDLQDRLVEVQQGTAVLGRFLYDFAGRRTEKIGAEGVRQYVYDQTSLLAEYSDTGLQVAKYDYGADRLISLERGGQRRYYLFDALRSVTNITDEAGATQASYHLDAWGNFRTPAELNPTDPAASKNRFAFTGYLWDQETSLYYAKARFYDPEVGRFTTQDSFLGEINDPPSLHRYVYANARPTFFIDPTGHSSVHAMANQQRFQTGPGIIDQGFASLAELGWDKARSVHNLAVNTFGSVMYTYAGAESFRSQHEALRDVVPPALEATYKTFQSPQELVTRVWEGNLASGERYRAAFERGDIKGAQAEAIPFLGQVAGARFAASSFTGTPGAAIALTPQGATVTVGTGVAANPGGLGAGILMMAGTNGKKEISGTQGEQGNNGPTGGDRDPLPADKSPAQSRYSGALVTVPNPDPAADALAGRLGGQARVKFASDPLGREFDTVSEQFVAQTKLADVTINQRVRNQFKATMEAAKETGRQPYFHFQGGEPSADVLKRINEYAQRYGVEPVIDTNPLDPKKP